MRVYNVHANAKPKYEAFHNMYAGAYATTKAPKGPPSAQQLHDQARSMQTAKAPGMDGFK